VEKNGQQDNSDRVRAPRRLGVALGGGSAKGWAHIGALQALIEYGWTPQYVAGTSIGAVVGVALAAGNLAELAAWARQLTWRRVMGYLDLGFGGGLIRAHKVLFDFLELLEGRSIASLQLPFGAVATDLATGREVWITEGAVLDAVRASISIPGVIVPHYYDGRWLVDGGLVNPVPVTLCRALGAETVVAIDLQTTLLDRAALSARNYSDDNEDSLSGQPDEAGEEKPEPSIWTRLRQRARELQGNNDNKPPDAPSIYEVIANSLGIMQWRLARSRLAGDPPELLITPKLPQIGLLDFHEAAAAIAEGRRAAHLALAALTLPRGGSPLEGESEEED